ncbi:MAG: HD domain-containing protein [Minisyncoccota bacterium]
MTASVTLTGVRQVVARYGNTVALFEYLEQYLDTKSIQFLQRVNRCVTQEFCDIARDSGEAYITHLHGVFAIGAVYCGHVDDVELLAGALLHDIMEEFPKKWPLEAVAEISTLRVALMVDRCSIKRSRKWYGRGKGNYSVEKYFARLSESQDAVRVKLWDRLHNQITLSACSIGRQKRKNMETERYIIPLAKQNEYLFEELSASVEETKIRLSHSSLKRRNVP